MLQRRPTPAPECGWVGRGDAGHFRDAKRAAFALFSEEPATTAIEALGVTGDRPSLSSGLRPTLRLSLTKAQFGHKWRTWILVATPIGVPGREDQEESIGHPVAGTPVWHRRGRSRHEGTAAPANAAGNGGIIVPVAAVALAWALFFTPDSTPELRLSHPGDTGPSVATGTWSVGQESVAGYRLREKLLRLPASNDAVGRTSAVTGSFRLSGDRTDLRVEKGMRIDVEVSKLKSDEDRRDDHMRTMAIESDLYPTTSFVTTFDRDPFRRCSIRPRPRLTAGHVNQSSDCRPALE